MVLSTTLLFFSGIGLFAWWRKEFAGEARITRAIVGAAFAMRTCAGLGLFWISQVRLPIAQALQRGGGLWFFAEDARIYLDDAMFFSHHGLFAERPGDPIVQAAAFSKTLAVFFTLFGGSAVAALLLNAICFLAMCSIVLRWARAIGAPRNVTLIAILALSLSPSGVLWSTQPLKESFFQLTVVAFFACCFVWQRAWRDGRAETTLAASLGLIALLPVIAGIRWYFAGVVLGGCVVFFIVNAWAVPRRRVRLFVLAVPFVLALAQGVVAGGGRSVVPQLRDAMLLDPQELRTITASFAKIVPRVRGNLERLGGTTTIRVATKTPRIAGGALAMFVPRAVLAPLGVVALEGNRAFWLGADIDTLFFDAIVFAGIALSLRRVRQASPVFWLIAFVIVVMTIALSYTIPNFGLLFRLRSLILTGCALLPLARRSGGEEMRHDILDAAHGDDLDVGADLRGVALREEDAPEAERRRLASA